MILLRQVINSGEVKSSDNDVPTTFYTRDAAVDINVNSIGNSTPVETAIDGIAEAFGKHWCQLLTEVVGSDLLISCGVVVAPEIAERFALPWRSRDESHTRTGI